MAEATCRAGIAERRLPEQTPFTGLFTWRHCSVVKELLRGMRRPGAGASLWDATETHSAGPRLAP
jgi:hypothetical protein